MRAGLVTAPRQKQHRIVWYLLSFKMSRVAMRSWQSHSEHAGSERVRTCTRVYTHKCVLMYLHLCVRI